jgi:hypothetical protein
MAALLEAAGCERSRSRLWSRFGLGVALVLGLGAASAYADGASLAREAMAIIQSERPSATAERDPKAPDCLQLRKPDGGSARMCFDNMARYLAGASEAERKAEILKQYDASLRQIGEAESYEQAEPKLRLQLTRPEMFKELGAGALASRPFSKALVIAAVIDAPEGYAYVTSDKLKAWKRSQDEVFAKAARNLDADRDAPAIEPQGSPTAGRYVASLVRDGYMAARLLSPSYLARLREALGDKAFCMIPNRDFLLCWTPDFSKRSQFVAQARKDYERYSHPLSTEIFVVEGDAARLAETKEDEAQTR